MTTGIIIGAGLAGPIAALGLSQKTDNSTTWTVYERTSSPRTIGGAVNIAPNGMRLLHRLGLHDEVIRHGHIVPSFELRNERGVLIGYFPNKSPDGFSGVRIMRSEFQSILLAELKRRGIEVHFGKVLMDIRQDQEDGKVVAKFEDGTETAGDLLIGADGIHSTVRKCVVGDGVKPEYTGTSLVYGLVNTASLGDVDISSMHATSGIFGQKAFFAYAFCDETRKRLYWISAKETPLFEKLEDPDIIREQELSKFSTFYYPIPSIISQTTEFFQWPVYELPSLKTWIQDSDKGGKIILIGDAAHALPPDKGQGVSQAIEDVFTLARVLESGKSLQRYEELRRPRVEALRSDIKRNRKDRKIGPWRAWLRDWLFWVFLGLMNLFRDLLPIGSDFNYDPDKVEI